MPVKSLKIAAAVAVLSLGMSPALHAGGLADAVIETEIVEVEPAGSMAGWIIPLVIVGLLVLIAQGDDEPNPCAAIIIIPC